MRHRTCFARTTFYTDPKRACRRQWGRFGKRSYLSVWLAFNSTAFMQVWKMFEPEFGVVPRSEPMPVGMDLAQ